MTRWLLGGDFWIADDGSTLYAFDRASGGTLRVDGALREAVLEGRHSDARLQSLGRLEPRVGALVAALSEGLPRPFTRADLLRGSGFALLFIELTARCNERCSHCYADAAPERTESLSWTVIRDVIDDAAALGFGTVQLTGGDPLLHPQLVDAALHVRERGIANLEIYTNGLLLNSRLLDHLAPARPRFAFSIYSHDAHAHDAVTGVRGSHARTLHAIRACLERGLPVRAGVILFEHSAHQREAIRAALLELGLRDDAIGFSASRAVGRGRAHAVDDATSVHGLESGGDAGKAAVSYDGRVYPCIFARDLPLGSVHERSLRRILEEPLPIVADANGLGERAARAGEQLTCLECRMRDAMIAPARASQPLIQLSGLR